jgi:hypothetical protein
MRMKSERLQILIEPTQRERLEQLAAARRTSIGSLVREAIDLSYPAQSARRATAARNILDADAMDVPDPADLRAELDEIRGRHG